MTQVINWSGDSGDGVYIGGGGPKDTNHTPFKAMTFRVRKITAHPYSSNTKTITNTNIAQTFVRSIDANHLKESNAVEGKAADFNLKERGYSLYDSVSSDRGYSVINEFDGFNADGMERLQAFLGSGKSSVSSSQFGKDSLRSAGANGKGMARSNGSSDTTTEFVNDFLLGAAAFVWNMAQQRGPWMNVAKAAHGFIKVSEGILNGNVTENLENGLFHPDNLKNIGINRPGPDDIHGEGGSLTPNQIRQLPEVLRELAKKDPITNWGDKNGGGLLTSEEIENMESNIRKAKDITINWGDEQQEFYAGEIEMNIGEMKKKSPITNWGDGINVLADAVEAVLTVQDPIF